MYGVLIAMVLYFANEAITYYSLARDLEALDDNAVAIVNQSNTVNQMQVEVVHKYADIVGYCTKWELSENEMRAKTSAFEAFVKDRDSEFLKLEGLMKQRQTIGDSVNLKTEYWIKNK